MAFNIKKFGILILFFALLLIISGYVQSMVGVSNPVLGGVGIPIFGAVVLAAGFWVMRKKLD